MDTVTPPMLTELVLVTAKSVVRDDRPPFPSEFVAVFIIFGGAALVGQWNPKIGAAFGWGIVVATALNVMPFISSGALPNSVTNRTGNPQPNPGTAPQAPTGRRPNF